MTISNNGFDCEEMYGQPCVQELEAVRDGTLTFGEWPDDEAKLWEKNGGAA